MSGWLAGWRLALRLARRDLLKHRARAAIALVMITLPVLGVVAADVLIQTARVSPAEGVSRRIGTAATAEVQVVHGGRAVAQGSDPAAGWDMVGQPASGAAGRPATTLADIERIIGRRHTQQAVAPVQALVHTRNGREPMAMDLVDPAAPLTHGLYRLLSGHWPTEPGEVVVNRAVLDRGTGTRIRVFGQAGSEETLTVVGTIVDATRRTEPVMVGLPGTAGIPDPAAGNADGDPGQAWYVDGPAITWTQVQRLNRLGVLVTDRRLAGDPGAHPAPVSSAGGIDSTTAQVAALVVVMALIEVVLLAGPAFAVGARKQQRSLALLVSAGGTPKQARRVIIAGGLLLGLSGGVIGVLGGIVVARLLQPAVQRFNPDWFGPFDVRWPHLVAVAVFGLVSALIACLVPAWIASRQNVVAVLAGRRGDAKPVRAFPLLGLGLFGIGVVIAWGAARTGGGGELTIAWSAVVCVLGMVLLVPVVVNAVARSAARAPLAVRFAARDAVRHRTRTTPAVAAVAATVAGVVALGISTSSDEKESRETYTATLSMGNAAVTPSDLVADPQHSVSTAWDRVTAVVRQQLPDTRIVPVRGVGSPAAGSWTDVTFRAASRATTDEEVTPQGWQSSFGSSVLVDDGTSLPPTVSQQLPMGTVRAALAAGKAVVLAGDAAATTLREVVLHAESFDSQGERTATTDTTVPAVVLDSSGHSPAPAQAILPPALARRAGLPVAVTGLELVHPGLSPVAQRDLAAALADLPTPAGLYVERGYQAKAETVVLQWVLAGLAAILMLGGTLTAMFLSLADARPDLATLAAVGAAPRTRRSVAAAYTFVVSFVGAVLGMLVGFVPGLAVTWPLTAHGPGARHVGPYIDIPWLLITVVVVGLPVLSAVLVGAATRSRLPMVARQN